MGNEIALRQTLDVVEEEEEKEDEKEKMEVAEEKEEESRGFFAWLDRIFS